MDENNENQVVDSELNNVSTKVDVNPDSTDKKRFAGFLEKFKSYPTKKKWPFC